MSDKQVQAVARAMINRPMQIQAVGHALLIEQSTGRESIHGPQGISDARWRGMIKRAKTDGGTEKVAERM